MLRKAELRTQAIPHIRQNAKKHFDSLNFRVSFFSAWGPSARSANPAPAALIYIFKFKELKTFPALKI